MIVNEVVSGVIAVIVGYLLGSFPSAYLITRWLTGKDIRQLGGGNAGARNTYREVGLRAGIAVAVLDIAKGAAAVALAHWLLDAPLYGGEVQFFILLTALAAVAGHMWSVYLKFTGGNGLAATIGGLVIIMPWELLIVLGLMLILTAFTRNPVLSLNISLLSLPVSAWFLEVSWLAVGFTIVLLLVMIINFVPTARAAMAKAGNRGNLAADLLHRNKAGVEGQKEET